MGKRNAPSTSSGTPRATDSRAASHRASKNPRSGFGMVAGCAVAVALIIPFVIWGNPYPPQILRYWGGGTVIAALVAIVCFKWYEDTMRPVGDAISRLSPMGFSLLVASVTTASSAIIAVHVFHRFAT